MKKLLPAFLALLLATSSQAATTSPTSGTVTKTSNGGTGTATTFTQGSVVFSGASGVYAQDNANLFYDATNHRLGIGTSTPSGSTLGVSGGVSIGSTYNAVAITNGNLALSGLLSIGTSNAATNLIQVNSGATSELSLSAAGALTVPGIIRTTGSRLQSDASGAALTFNSATGYLNINNDTSISRNAAGVVQIGTNSASALGTLIAANIGIGTATPLVALDASTKTDALGLPIGTDGARPATPASGYTRYNSTANTKGWLESYSSMAHAFWVVLQTLVGSGLETTNTASTNASNLQSQENALVTLGTSTLATGWGIPAIQIPRGTYPYGVGVNGVGMDIVPWIKLQTSGNVRFDMSSNAAITGVTNATTLSSSPTLHFAVTPAGCRPGAYVMDVTTPAHISAGTQVSFNPIPTATTLTMTVNAFSTVASGDTISCSYVGVDIRNDYVPTNDFNVYENDENAAPVLNTSGGSLNLTGPGASVNAMALKIGSEIAAPTSDQQAREINLGYISATGWQFGMGLVANQMYITQFNNGGHLGGGGVGYGISTTQNANQNSGENVHFGGAWILDGWLEALHFDTPGFNTVFDGASFDFNTTMATSGIHEGSNLHSFINGHMEENVTLVNCAATNNGAVEYLFKNQYWVPGSAAPHQQVMFKGACHVDIDSLHIAGYAAGSVDPANLFMMDSNIIPVRVTNIEWEAFSQLTSQYLLLNDDPCFAQGVSGNDLQAKPASTIGYNTPYGSSNITAAIAVDQVWTTGMCSTSKSIKFTRTGAGGFYGIIFDRMPVDPGDHLYANVVYRTDTASSPANLGTRFIYSGCNAAIPVANDGSGYQSEGIGQVAANTWGTFNSAHPDTVPVGACFAQLALETDSLGTTEHVWIGMVGVNKE